MTGYIDARQHMIPDDYGHWLREHGVHAPGGREPPDLRPSPGGLLDAVVSSRAVLSPRRRECFAGSGHADARVDARAEQVGEDEELEQRARPGAELDPGLFGVGLPGGPQHCGDVGHGSHPRSRLPTG
ncbi:hypothetical protein [Spongiactinospora sp. TRM90649]|uniref:hypothetical protein n=1 Tax=Spongiactinospora sp. TRM90649 TaxID=3031114 RepID=UPI0023F880B8|nr:hypothetical protein [Spongiactinospora sp. TRM90649]MDF5755496.1 hypothetical protein [Spongiactinospora sp. TRM90649]